MANSTVSTGIVYVATRGTGNSIVSTGIVYVATVAGVTPVSTVSTGLVYAATRGTGNSIVSAGLVYVAIYPAGPWKVGGNVTIILDGTDITAYIDNSKLDGILQVFQSTVFSSAAQEYLPTTGKWAFPLGGKWSITSDGILFPIANQGSSVELKITFSRRVTYWWTSALMIDYRIETPSPRDAIQWLGSVVGLGAPARA